MIKIELELPDWADERTIYVMAGIELIAYRFPGKTWQVKSSRCNMCGKCCMKLGERHPFPVINGRCVYLVKRPGKNCEEHECILRMHRPFGCCVAVLRNVSECTEKFEKR